MIFYMSPPMKNLSPASPTAIPVEAVDRARLFVIPKLLLLGATVFAAGELSWRFTGLRPGQSDLLVFDRIYRSALNSSHAVALIGSSRVLCDLDPRILKRELPQWDFYQLGIDGASALPMLENLAQDVQFRGRVLCEFSMVHFTAEYPFRADPHADKYVEFVRRRSYFDFLNTRFSEALRQRSALVAGTFGFNDMPAKDCDFITALGSRLASLVRNPSGAGSASLSDSSPRDDRFHSRNRRGKDNSWSIARWVGWIKSSRGTGANIQRVASWVDAIRRRGGDVVFIRMPVSGSLRLKEDEIYPDRVRFMQSLGDIGISMIDSAREPTLSGFECSDESHLDADDADRFSTSLARILDDRKLLMRAARSLR